MDFVSKCVICDSTTSHLASAAVAPFLARRIWQRPSFPCELIRCDHCNFRFFNPRMDEAEVTRLYHGYRGSEYQRTRFECEPWYTARLNESLMKPTVIERRKAVLTALLSKNVRLPAHPKILDFGGDRGQLVSGLLPDAQPYVFDISAVEPVAGVRSCSTLDGCREVGADLIICSNTLEHVNYPLDVVKQIIGIASPSTKIFVEVPFESPQDPAIIRRRLVQMLLTLLLRPKVGLHLARQKFLLQMHEHVNFFDRQSLRTLMTAGGGGVLSDGVYDLKGSLGDVVIGWCLGQRTPI